MANFTKSNNHNIMLFDLIDDLSVRECKMLLTYLWVNGYSVTRANIKTWRKVNGYESMV